MLTADARQAEIYQKQEEQSTKVSSAAALLAGIGDSGDGSTESDGGSASAAAGSRNTAGDSLRGATGNNTGQARLHRPNPERAKPGRGLQEWAVQQPAEYQDSDGENISQARTGNELVSVATGHYRKLQGEYDVPPTDGSRWFDLINR